MLYIRFGTTDKTVDNVPLFFSYSFEREWFDDELVRRMVKDVDKSEVVAGSVIDSQVLGPISPLELSGGLKTLIMMLFEPEYEYYGTACGDNCGKWMVEIGKRQDVLIALTRIMRFRPPEEVDVGGMNAFCVNTNQPINSMRDFMNAYTSYMLTLEDGHEG